MQRFRGYKGSGSDKVCETRNGSGSDAEEPRHCAAGRNRNLVGVKDFDQMVEPFDHMVEPFDQG